MRNYLGFFRSLIHPRCNFPRPDYPRYSLLFDNFLKQWKYIENKNKIPNFSKTILKNIFNSLIEKKKPNRVII